MNSGIPVEKHLYIQVILSNQNEANYKLTTSSSQTAHPPPQQDVGYAQILKVLAALQSGMSSMQLALSSMQQEVHSINLLVEQS
jgi:hypothetical protein